MRSAIIITARTGSTRLPQKVVADVCGQTALELLVSRLRTATAPDMMVLATTDLPEDDDLALGFAQRGDYVYRGPIDDILARWDQAASFYDIDRLVICDGDDLFCDPEFVDRIAWMPSVADYISCEGLPFGTSPTGLSREAVKRACECKQTTSTEGTMRFVANADIRPDITLHAPDYLRHPTARMTLDYPEDLEFFRVVVSELGPLAPLRAIVQLLKDRPDIVAINASKQDEYWRRFNKLYPASLK